MNQQVALVGAPWSAAGGSPARTHSLSRAARLTFNGALLFLIGLAVLGSGFGSLRASVGGFLVHPYLFLIVLSAPLILLTRIHDFPAKPLIGILLFSALYAASSLDVASLPYVIKLAAGMLTVIVAALLVRTRADFVAGVAGLTLAIGILGFHGVAEEQEGGGSARVIEHANKNSYSLYAVPAMLLAGHVVTRSKSTPRLLKAMLVVSALGMLTAIFMSANRSGYVASVFVALLVFRERRIRGLILVLSLAGALIFWLKNYGTTEIVEERYQQTVEGTSGDEARKSYLMGSIMAGLNNPLLGLGQEGLTGYIGGAAHNVIASVVGGGGLLCFAALVYLGWSLWFWPVPRRPGQPPPEEFLEARMLLRCMMFLWLVRGQFSEEILYNPGFCLGLGLTIGLCIVGEQFARQRQGSPQRSRTGGSPALFPLPGGPIPSVVNPYAAPRTSKARGRC